ncbi:DNA mismatch repair protein MutS [Clostridium perfringens]|uniref:DNA mismatch repair protein MutS n=1 Tax=Clostridium perfringens (strain ATCC 13124 / DSM 756 / JCM 1290 / NCIMB 6125 / NCTC 8237 / Type A) TaxID=195103 RepID=MUTS_CLOP1|nr:MULTISPECIES: DNA mismatch repair protein MutS [Clostridium]Q0TRD6.1 RecName: Full=DNA mismatch repair protein MutS [Clostridium perfringens ATCC 13124]ABG82875.1 DNA mismatch repair protein MutS [Clostridium perfringens ATCC 13124]EGT0684775.1 DNA mismatch repair protein MutS [Clostridium perfringens]EGT0687431.1 DNA mismatch repair protein MutS [Clostridium perfringens]EGT3619907.1 DNA mismatch repair protein MutS [Clostridium perfringens]EGT4141984.1 DNA mismatch repair protein MutS [Cl
MKLTPMMRQYFEIKENYKDCILFFRLGDFYEMFFEDAETAARELELVLTGRDCGLEKRAPMCGIPFHASNSYIGRLVAKGYKVAICEQVEDPKFAKGIVKRDVIKVITPGTYTDSSFVEETKNNYIMTIYADLERNRCSLAITDISTGDFLATEGELEKGVILDEISKFNPKEIILLDSLDQELIKDITLTTPALISRKPIEYFEENFEEVLNNQFGEKSNSLSLMVKKSSNALVKYILDTQKISLTNINDIEVYSLVDFMTIDLSSRRNLELTENLREKSKKGSLLWVLDKTETSMGSRMLRRWIEEPLVNKEKITLRLNAVEELFNDLSLNDSLKEALHDIYDIERILGKISNKNANAKDLIALKTSIGKIPNVKGIIENCTSSLLKNYHHNLDDLRDIYDLLEKSIKEDPSLTLKDGDLIKDGFNGEIDELRLAKTNGKDWISSLENREREFTGIKSLKVGFNKVFGYYIEISKANYSSIPEGRYIRKQTLANAERFITPELKEIEEKLLGASEKLCSLEYDIFLDIRNEVENHIDRLKTTAKIIAELDCISNLAFVALENDFIKPEINEDGETKIENGRHPVVEKVIPKGEFIPNDTIINKDDNQLLIITGPNMAGKSTYMRQVAIITLMCQIGSFVPASKANISVVDKIFTRIGASDDLAGGKSTFMVEMWEVSNILKNATENSLVLLDEVGRGTSTYDGLSIAWSVIEYICKNKNLRCKTLFATHYHELTKLEGEIHGVRNYSVAVKEVDNNIIFLRKIIEGGADQSYGIEVAKLAGIPDEVINRAKEILETLEMESSKDNLDLALKEVNASKEDIEEASITTSYEVKETLVEEDKIEIKEEVISKASEAKTHKKEDDQIQLDFSAIGKDNLIKELSEVDILSLNPMEAMNRLYALVKEAKNLI